MTLASDISTTSTALSDIKQAIIDKGVTPSGNITTYATAIGQISGGGGKYQLLQRISDDSNNEIGTVSGFFTDANNVEYAVVCLDAKYRLASGTYCSNISTAVTNLPINIRWPTWEAKETATFNTQKILDFCTAQSATSTACSHCRKKSFTIDGTRYYGQLPNIVELVDICKNYTAIQSADTSVSQYRDLGLPITDKTWSSSQYSRTSGWCVDTFGTLGSITKTGNYFVAPVLEIPNN